MIEEIDIESNEQELYGKDWFNAEYLECLVDLDEELSRPETIISIGEHSYKDKTYPTPVMTAGEFSCITAPSKSKKSFFKSQLASAYIGGKASEHFENIKGHRDKDSIILDCDTEQSKYYAQRTFERTRKITGDKYENYIPLKMRHLTAEQRVSFIDHLLQSERFKGKVKLVFIDGVADLIEDSNDLVMSNYIAQKLLTWTDQYNIHICVIIHNAYNTVKPTGHLGSAVVKKAESVILLEPTDESKKVIKVRHLYSRGREFEEFYFTINDNDALPYQCDEVGTIGQITLDDYQPAKPKGINPSEAFDPPEDDNDVPF
jgi:hypothetical protein